MNRVSRRRIIGKVRQLVSSVAYISAMASNALRFLGLRLLREDDVYMLPLIESLHYMREPEGKFEDFHLSYHPSGEFHWAVNGTHIQPLFGEADFRKALELWLKFKSPPCLCFRKGKGLREEEILALIQHLARYLPLKIDVREVAQNLKGSNFYRLVRRDLRKVS